MVGKGNLAVFESSSERGEEGRERSSCNSYSCSCGKVKKLSKDYQKSRLIKIIII